MGKGDKRSKRGKIWKHSHGVCRLKKSYQMTTVEKIEKAKSK
ncbi:MAG: 30S ribosomal protein THX [Bacteroidota bacterium]|nr:30S ribosomal protein THX [Bacteroidota bacterium]